VGVLVSRPPRARLVDALGGRTGRVELSGRLRTCGRLTYRPAPELDLRCTLSPPLISSRPSTCDSRSDLTPTSSHSATRGVCHR
jgi:hypothetical protein